MSDLTVLGDMKAAFANFQNMTDLLTWLEKHLADITKFNHDAAGNDSYGQQYHQAVDGPTAGLLDLLHHVYAMVTLAGTAGQYAANGYAAADEHGVQAGG